LWTTTCPISGSGLSPAHCQPSCLSSLCLLKVNIEISSLPLTPSPVHFQSFQCILYYSGFFCGAVSLPRGLCWFIPWVAGGIPHDAWCSPVWSAEFLPSRFGASIWWQQQSSCFHKVTWSGKAFYGLGAQVVKVLILLGVLFPPSVAPASQQGF
jgi:hypothetical protein